MALLLALFMATIVPASGFAAADEEGLHDQEEMVPSFIHCLDE